MEIACVDGVWILVGLLGLTSLWYGGIAFLNVLAWARVGVLHVPLLVVAGVELWVGGAFALAAGTLLREPPGLPDRASMVGWTVFVFVLILGIVLMRRPEVEEQLPDEVRQSLDGRFVLVGALVAAAVLFAAGYHF